MEVTEEIQECAFEPDSFEVRCMDCDRRTGVVGTCKDVALCPACRAGYIAAGFSELEVSEMIITLIEGRGYKTKYVRKRVLHLSINGKTVCGAKGGPHPLTTHRNESNRKRCLAKAHQ
jgi:ribosomal protein S27E